MCINIKLFVTSAAVIYFLMIKYFLCIAIFSLCNIQSYTTGLRWTNSGLANTNSSRISMKDMLTVEVDIHMGEEIVIVRDVRRADQTISIYCFIDGYHTTRDIEFSFCKNTICFTVYASAFSNSYVQVYGLSLNFKTNFNNRKGININMLLPTDTSDISGNYYCKASDKTNTISIRSNIVQIRDLLYWEENLVMNANHVKKRHILKITRDSLPQVFPCLETGLKLNPIRPYWINQEFVTPVSWSVCPVKNNYRNLTSKEKVSFIRCIECTVKICHHLDDTLKPRSLSEMTKWSYTVNNKGQLIIFDVETESNFTDISHSLMCYRKTSNVRNQIAAITTYTSDYHEDNIISGISFIGGPVVVRNKLEAISPLKQEVTVYVRKIGNDDKPKPISIYASYRASSLAIATWKFNGVILKDSASLISNRYRVDFIADINHDMAGNYVLEVENEDNILILTIIVTVIGQPTVLPEACLPPVRYVWENEDTRVKCSYLGRPTELKLGINGEEMKLDPHFSSSSFNIQKTHPYLSELNFTVSPSIYTVSDQVTMTYNAFNLRKTPGQVVYQDHTVMFSVKNDFGSVMKSTSVYTVPRIKPLVKGLLHLFSCAEHCHNRPRHYFKCRIDVEVFANKELAVDHYWTINGTRLGHFDSPRNRFSKLFTIDPISKDLMLNELIGSTNTSDNGFLKDVLRDNFLVCNIDLKGSSDADPPFRYYSRYDSSLANILKTRIPSDYLIQSDTPRFLWNIPVIILFIIMVMSIIPVIYCIMCCQRKMFKVVEQLKDTTNEKNIYEMHNVYEEVAFELSEGCSNELGVYEHLSLDADYHSDDGSQTADPLQMLVF